MMESSMSARYQRYLRLEKGFSPNTVDAYMRDLGKLLRYLFTERTDVLEVRLEQLEHFAASLADLGISARSMARILSGVRQFYRWLVLDGYLKADPTVLLESPICPRCSPLLRSICWSPPSISPSGRDSATKPSSRCSSLVVFASPNSSTSSFRTSLSRSATSASWGRAARSALFPSRSELSTN